MEHYIIVAPVEGWKSFPVFVLDDLAVHLEAIVKLLIESGAEMVYGYGEDSPYCAMAGPYSAVEGETALDRVGELADTRLVQFVHCELR